MPLCVKCGVEIQEGEMRCPLCLAPLGGEETAVEREGHHDMPNVPDSDGREKIWRWELVTFLALGAVVIVFAIDFAYGKAVTWARYPLSSIAFVWSALSLAIRMGRRTVLLLFGEAAALGLYLWFLDGFTPGKPWFFPLALPIVTVAFFLLGATIGLVRRFKLTRAGILSAGIASAGIFMLVTEIIINRFIIRPVFVSWSLVAFACIITFIGLLGYLQGSIKKNKSHLKKFFHL